MGRNSFLPIWPVLLAGFLAAGCLMTKKAPRADAVDYLPEVAAAMYAGRTWLIADRACASSWPDCGRETRTEAASGVGAARNPLK